MDPNRFHLVYRCARKFLNGEIIRYLKKIRFLLKTKVEHRIISQTPWNNWSWGAYGRCSEDTCICCNDKIGQKDHFSGWSTFFIVLPCTIILCLDSTSAASLLPKAEQYIEKGSYLLETNKGISHALNEDIPYIPASTIKIVTSLLVLESFGAEHRFVTSVYHDDDNNLYIRGGGDPFLTSEAIRDMAGQLGNTLTTSFNSLILDDTPFELEASTPGAQGTDNPYDAQSGALVVNFNTVTFKKAGDCEVSSGERQTPLLPIMNDLALTYPSGRHRVNVGILDSNNVGAAGLRYSGELFLAILAEEGFSFKAGYSIGKVPQQARLLLHYKSQFTLAEMIRRCLLYSNNYVANQLFLLAGSKHYGAPATWKKARATANRYIALELQLSPDQATMVDGSGLSTKNRISAKAMLKALHRFLPHYQLLPKELGIYMKSGTLTHVYAYAGYFPSHQGPSPFVIMLNQPKNYRDSVLQLLQREIDRLNSDR